MTRHDKITEMLSLIDVPPSEMMLARRNYEKLSEAEIDDRLGRLRGSARVIEAWRTHHHLVRTAASASATDWVEKGVPQAPVLAADAAPGSIIVRHRSRKRPTAFDAGESDWFHQYMSTPLEPSAEIRLEDRPGWEFLRNHPLLTASDSPWLAPGELVDALARLANVVKKYQPDVILGLNEGQWIGQALKSHLGLASQLINLSGPADADLDWSQVRPKRPAKIVCVIGHVAKTGLALSEAVAKSRELFQTQQVFGMVLAASTIAAKYFSDARDIRYHQIIGPLDPHSSISFQKFSVTIASTRVLITSSQKLLMKRYPVDPMPWEQHQAPSRRMDA